MLRQRLLLGPILILIVTLGIWLDEVIDAVRWGPWLTDLTGRETWPPGVVVFIAVCACAWLGALELRRLFIAAGLTSSRRVAVILALVGLATAAFIPESVNGVTGAAIQNSVVTIVLIGTLIFHSRRRQVKGSIAQAGGALLVLVYLGMMFGFLVLLRRENSAWTLLWVLITTKSCDIGAYFTGRSIGRRKLIPWLSPGKTWEGFFGGMVWSGLIGAGGIWLLHALGLITMPNVWQGGVMGLLFGAVGQLGDLFMSLLKRDAGVKDAGRSLPGFGGIMDVLDSLLLVAPLAFWLLRVTHSSARGPG